MKRIHDALAERGLEGKRLDAEEWPLGSERRHKPIYTSQYTLFDIKNNIRIFQ
jgi:hypothetical protein